MNCCNHPCRNIEGVHYCSVCGRSYDEQGRSLTYPNSATCLSPPMKASDYPDRDKISIPSTGDEVKDQEIIDRFIVHEKRLIEGICPNECGELTQVNQTTRQCPVCGFTSQTFHAG